MQETGDHGMAVKERLIQLLWNCLLNIIQTFIRAYCFIYQQKHLPDCLQKKTEAEELK